MNGAVPPMGSNMPLGNAPMNPGMAPNMPHMPAQQGQMPMNNQAMYQQQQPVNAPYPMNNGMNQMGAMQQPGAMAPQQGMPAANMNAIRPGQQAARPAAPVESKVEVKSLKIPDFLKK